MRQNKPRKSVLWAALFFAVWMALSINMPSQAQGTPTPTPTIGLTNTPNADAQLPPDVILQLAQNASENAKSAVDSANTILTLIQSFGVMLGGLIAVAGILGTLVGIRTLTDFNETRERFRTEMEQALERLQGFERRVEEDTAAMRKQGDQAIRALTLLQLGKQQMDSNNLDAARNALEQAYQYDPNNRAVNYFLGELYIQLELLDKGLEHLRLAGAELPADERGFPAAKAAYAYAFRRKGDIEPDGEIRRDFYYRSEGLFREALRNNPKLLDIEGESFYGALGGLYRRQGRYQDAIECYEQAINATGSTSSYPYNNLGILYTRLKNEAKAALNFERAAYFSAQRLDDKPQDYWARFDMVTAQTMLNNEALVDKHLLLALQSAPTLEKVQTFLNGLRALLDLKESPLLEKTVRLVENDVARRSNG
jgi:tetratricopeptide (TPR) repeat protein